ncbi:hypothetical protein F3Y22_tig00112230pilonHSYRG00177 [Hibiscus syriacus]|uniref:Clp1 N-terminal domain-containing protein n=1 Tax=Hibiscus syriacus TaxID=106335 RepID=A0A6A2X4A1_HIBSY|nr:hypothetical protein F3Y22_tig00112230pilonHSYRG00177 [Hibiscus syriacus]
MMAPAVGGSASTSSLKQVKLERESELRIEVGNETPLKLRLLNGSVEIFGTELAPETWLTFPPRVKFAVFTWYGSTIEMDGVTETDYTADETPMISYVNVHAVLDARRKRAKACHQMILRHPRDPKWLLWGLQILERAPYQGCFLVGQLNKVGNLPL